MKIHKDIGVGIFPFSFFSWTGQIFEQYIPPPGVSPCVGDGKGHGLVNMEIM